MPKFFCDYCDVYLTHDSMSVRKAHNSGRNHLRNVVDYYQQIGQEKAQAVIDSITDSYESAGQAASNPLNMQGHFGGPGFNPAFPPPGQGFPPPGMPPLPFHAGPRGMPLPLPPQGFPPGFPPIPTGFPPGMAPPQGMPPTGPNGGGPPNNAAFPGAPNGRPPTGPQGQNGFPSGLSNGPPPNGLPPRP